MLSKIRRLIHAIRKIKPIYKHGGISSVAISTPTYSNILEGKNVLITGGSSGIGFAIAKKCASCGANVLISGRNESKLKKAVTEIGEDRCKYIVWDLSAIEDVKVKLDECENMLGGDISVLINNAGVPPTKFWGDVDDEEWDRIYNTNLKGLYFITQELVSHWKQHSHVNYKKIINVSSQGGFVGATYPYRMVKWDIRGLTEGLGKTLIKDNIIVNGIAPGVVRTAMQSFSLQQGDNLYTNQNPIERVILPEEIAELALFLISDASNAIVGQTIVCDGGYTLK